MEAMTLMDAKKAALELFDKSVLKQQKYEAIVSQLGPTDSLRCLDLGGDNGVISHLLRERGGRWSSADLEEMTVTAIRSLVETDVYQTDGRSLPFADLTFDRVVIVDLLEHVADDRALIAELHRIMKQDGILLINVPYWKDDILRKLRYALGQTDEQHGHLRPGYTPASIEILTRSGFEVETYQIYSGFFAELLDTLIVFGMSILKGSSKSKKGLVVTGRDLDQHRSAFRAFSALYPVFRAAVSVDRLFPSESGYKLLVKARVRSASESRMT